MTLDGALSNRQDCTRTLCAGARQRLGFTLVELVIATGLIGLLAATATFFWRDGFWLMRSVNADSATIAEGRATLERLAREVREVKYDPVNAQYCVTTMTLSRMVFRKTPPGDTANPSCSTGDIVVTIDAPVSPAVVYLAYADGGVSAAPAASAALTGYRNSFGIRYLDSSYAATANIGALRFVELSLTVKSTDMQATQVRTVVALRNQ